MCRTDWAISPFLWLLFLLFCSFVLVDAKGNMGVAEVLAIIGIIVGLIVAGVKGAYKGNRLYRRYRPWHVSFIPTMLGGNVIDGTSQQRYDHLPLELGDNQVELQITPKETTNFDYIEISLVYREQRGCIYREWRDACDLGGKIRVLKGILKPPLRTIVDLYPLDIDMLSSDIKIQRVRNNEWFMPFGSDIKVYRGKSWPLRLHINGKQVWSGTVRIATDKGQIRRRVIIKRSEML